MAKLNFKLVVVLGICAVTTAHTTKHSNADQRRDGDLVVCYVSDPTGTPLNVRETPGGPVKKQLPNRLPVQLADSYSDSRGRLWTFVMNPYTGDPIGWVFRKYLSC
jgi:hypothetical protein